MDALSWLRDADLVPPLRRLAGGDIVSIRRWTAVPFPGGFGSALGVWLVSGEAHVDGVSTPFRLVLKGWRRPEGHEAPSAWDASDRELRAYSSGILDDLPPPVRSPRLLGEIDAGPVRWAWFSPVPGDVPGAWDLEHFALVARHLGQMNGVWLVSRDLPDADWLSRDFLRGKLPTCVPDLLELERLRDHPLVSRAYPPHVIRAMREIWRERDAWLSAIDALPRTFCHLDAWRRNAFLRLGMAGEPETFLIDWAFAGIAAVGEEVAPLTTASLYVGETTGISPWELDRTVSGGYLTGLRAAGWRGDPSLARAGYTGAVVLRYLYCPCGVVIGIATNPANHRATEAAFGIPIAAILDRFAEVNAWILDIAAEFRQHLASNLPDMPGESR